ncbi:large conductance mechanosensitive channel protein MscL [uncultured Rubinisphaera sp.]|uniref:large conductance mechanosensitive channel protein MscL n=1 Tax=uncultured Rubinisphaera sp. TaxID=1678686 RepID=UPI0026AB74CE|tara:strand:+ start:5403 stop:5921 length:519 start_codon:yes stop_codon:yes gene_type:complete
MAWKIIEDFKKFTLRGNMLDLAIGFTVGAAFTTVVKSFVNDILMPPIGLLTGGTDFSDLFVVLGPPEGGQIPEGGYTSLGAATEAGAVTLNYGVFINNCLSLLIVSMAIFIVIRLINRVDEKLDNVFDEEPPPPEEPSDKKCPHCRTVIPYRASRCPNCTSELEPVEGAVTA